MSINVNGSKITKFGKILPTPYLDKVEIKDTEITVFYSYYFQKPQEIENSVFDDYINETLSNLTTIGMIMPKVTMDDEATPFIHEVTTTSGATSTTTTYTDIQEVAKLFVINGKFDTKEALYDDSTKIYDLFKLNYLLQTFSKNLLTFNSGPTLSVIGSGPHHDMYNTFKQFATYHLSSSPEVLYDANGSEVRRYMYTRPITIDPSSTTGTYTLIDAVAAMPDVDFTLILVSTSLPFETSGDVYDWLDSRGNNNDLFRHLHGQQISDINCETIATGGTFKSTPERIYRSTVTGMPYTNGDILQSIDSRYYAVDESVRNDIVSSVRAVIQSGYKMPTGGTVSVNRANVSGELDDTEFNDARDNISYVLEVFDGSPNLVPQLNKALSAFSTTSTTTRVGRLHEKLEIAIFNANNAIKNVGSEIIKQINLNTYVKDLRTNPSYETSGRYSLTATADRIKFNEPNEYIYTAAAKYGCYIDPNEYEHAVFSPATGIYSYHISHGFISADDVRAKVGTRTESEIVAARSQILKWFSDSFYIGSPKATGNPGNSDMSKIIQFFGENGAMRESLPILSQMVMIGMGMANEIALNPVQLSRNVGGLSDASKMAAGSVDVLDGWYVSNYAMGTAPEWDSRTGWAKNLAKMFESVVSYYYQLLFEEGNHTLTMFQNSSGFYVPEVIAFQSYALAYYIIERYYENMSFSLTSFNTYLNGFWWFDYEKAIKEQSAISYIYSVKKLDDFFGYHLANGFFRVKETTIDRYYYCNDEEQSINEIVGAEHTTLSNLPDQKIKVGTLKTTITSGYGSTSEIQAADYGPESGVIYDTSVVDDATDWPRQMTAEVQQKNTDMEPSDEEGFVALGNLGVDVADNASREYTYSVMRNFKPLNDPDTDNYRLMCFEHQEVAGPYDNDTVYNTPDFPFSALVHSVHVEDSTIDLVYQIVRPYKDLLNGDFNDYYESAIEQCSYNSNDETFNDFFKTNAKNQFSDAPDTAPWFKMPVMYHFHVDLLYDTYKGSRDAIFAAAIIDSEKIAPDTGTFDMLVAFRQKVVNLFENEYDTIGLDNSVLNRLNATVFGGAGIERFEDLQGFPVQHRLFNDSGHEQDQTAFTNIPFPINLVNTLRFDSPPSPYQALSIELMMQRLGNAVANLTNFWSDDTGALRSAPNPLYSIYREHHDTEGWQTIRMNAIPIGKRIWNEFCADGWFGNISVRNDDNIGALINYINYATTTEDSNSLGGENEAQKMYDFRNHIMNWLATDYYVESSHPWWNIERSELPMTEFYSAINSTITNCIMIAGAMARSTYEYLTTAQNTEHYNVGRFLLSPVEISYGGSNVMQFKVTDYVEDELEALIIPGYT